MLNKRKIVSCTIDCIMVLITFTFILEIANYMHLSENILTYFGCFCTIIIIVYLLPYLFKKEKTIGKLVAKKLIKKEESKFTAKEIIIILIVLLIISFI